MSMLKKVLGVGAISFVLFVSGAALAGTTTAEGGDYAAWKDMAMSDSCMNADAS